MLRNYLSKNFTLKISAGILLLTATFILLFTNYFYTLLDLGSIWVREWFGSFYLWLGLVCVLFLVVTAVSPIGKHRLGNGKPEFNHWSWIAMLYSAGMGAGILLRSVQEPVNMFNNPPVNSNAGRDIIALEYTFFQWGFTAWAFYAIFALLTGIAVNKKNGSLKLGTSLEIFRKVSFLPAVINILTILTTVIGLVAAVGLGTTQIEGGISHLISKPSGNLWLTILLVFIICLIAALSAYTGMQKGIRRISNWNIYFTLGLVFFVFFQTNMGMIFSRFIKSLYRYLADFIHLSLALGDFNPGKEFLTDWTYYYWAFWLAWAPFTGIFIARISKGRSIREMIVAVLIIPSLGTFFWFSVFGSASFDLIAEWKTYNGQFDNVFTSLFIFFQHYPLPVLINSIVIILLISFLVTSVDSAIYVLSIFSAEEKRKMRKKHRVLWGLVILIFAEAIVLLGNIKPDTDVLIAMQKFLIIGSLPFAFLTAIIILLLSIIFLKTTSKKKGI